MNAKLCAVLLFASLLLSVVVARSSSSEEDADTQLLQALKRLFKSESKSEDKRAAWSPACSIGSGMPAYGCRLNQIQQNDDIRRWLATNPKSPGKR